MEASSCSSLSKSSIRSSVLGHLLLLQSQLLPTNLAPTLLPQPSPATGHNDANLNTGREAIQTNLFRVHNRGCVFTPELHYRDFPKSLSEIPDDLGRITSIGAPISLPASSLAAMAMAAGDGGSGSGRGTSGSSFSSSGCCFTRRHTPTAGEDMNQDRPPAENLCGLWSNGMDLLKDVAERKHFLPTGLEGIDMLLGGGLRQGQLTEITGPSSSGKTQVCLYSASHVAARHMGVVMYLDTSNSFSPSRIARIIDELPIPFAEEPKDVRLKRVMSSIICESVFDIFALFEVLHQLELSLNDKVNNGGSKICLLIIDSISSLLAPINGGKNSKGRSMMISVAMILKKLADEHNLSVLITNHMVAGNGAPKPALGESWKAVPHVRLLISRDRGINMCTATVLKHTLLASGRRMKFAVPG